LPILALAPGGCTQAEPDEQDGEPVARENEGAFLHVRELHRVVKPGGRLLVTGTSSRLSPKETHSGRWLVNYLPRGLDRRLGRNWQRGLSPLLLHRLVRRGFDDEDAADGGRSWASARAAMRGAQSPPLRSGRSRRRPGC
jgi:hypothetical protein